MPGGVVVLIGISSIGMLFYGIDRLTKGAITRYLEDLVKEVQG